MFPAMRLAKGTIGNIATDKTSRLSRLSGVVGRRMSWSSILNHARLPPKSGATPADRRPAQISCTFMAKLDDRRFQPAGRFGGRPTSQELRKEAAVGDQPASVDVRRRVREQKGDDASHLSGLGNARQAGFVEGQPEI